MAVKSFEANLYEHLNSFFAMRQYELLTPKKQYRRTTPFGFLNVILSVVEYGDESWLEINFGCRSQQVEQIAQQFLHNVIDYRPDANTILISIGKFTGQNYLRYKIRTPVELEKVCYQIQEFFDTTGFAFMEEASSLLVLDGLLNKAPDQPCRYVYNQVHRCYKGLVAAQLAHNPAFDSLVQTYRQTLMQYTQSPHEQLTFERLIQFLLHYSAN